MNIAQRLLITLITLYQRTLSPDHSWLRHQYPYGFCKFYPSCSEYAKQAIQYNGAIRGMLMAAYRLLRCNPWTKPSVDTIIHQTNH